MGKEMLDLDGAKVGFFPQAGKIPHGAGKRGSSLARGAEPGCCETPSGVKHPTWGDPSQRRPPEGPNWDWDRAMTSVLYP